MSDAVDTRIVQMQFDNKDFERNVKTSEKTLDKFKKYLDFSKCEKGLQTLDKAASSLSFDNLANNVQKLTDKFTGLGTMSELVISQIRRGIETAARKLSGIFDQLGVTQIKAGAEKYEKLNKNVQSIIAATGESEKEVYKIMQRLNAYTDQTSYDFVDMASNISKFTSVGIKLKDAEKEMEGIANWAARSGAGITEASRAMYNLSQAMGVGKMTTIDWKSIENANMATREFKEELIRAGLAMGTLEIDNKGVVKTAKRLGNQVEVNYQNLRETLQKGWANRQVLEKTLLGYYYENLDYDSKKTLKLTEEQLKENEKLFTDNKLDLAEWMNLEQAKMITDDVKKQLIELGLISGNLVKETTADGKEIVKTSDRYGKQIEVTFENIKDTMSVGWVDKTLAGQVGLVEELGEKSYEAAQKCLSMTDVFKAWKDQLSTGWMRFWQKIFGDLTESMQTFSAICDKVGDNFRHFVEVLVGSSEEGTSGIFGTWADVGGRESLWGMLIGEYDGMYEGAYGLLDVINDIGKMISDAIWTVLHVLWDPQSMDKNDDWLTNEKYRVEYLGKSIKEAMDKVKNFVASIKEWLNTKPEGQTKTRVEMLQDVLNGVASVAALVYRVVSDIFEFIGKLTGDKALGPAIDDIFGMFSELGNVILGTATDANKGKGLKVFLDDLYNILVDSGFFDALHEVTSALKELITAVFGSADGAEQTKVTTFWQSFAKVLGWVAKIISKVASPIIKFVGNFVGAIKDLVSGKINMEGFADRFKQGLRELINGIFSFTPDFTGKVSGIFTAIKNVFTTGFSKESIDELKSKVKSVFDSFKSSLPEGVKTTVKNIYTSIKTFLANTWTGIKNFFAPFFNDVKNLFTSGFSSNNITQIKERFKKIFKTISDGIPQSVKDAFGNIVGKIRQFLSEKWQAIKDLFSGKKVKKDLKLPKKGVFNDVFESDDTLGIGNMSIFDRVINWFKEGLEKIKSFFSNLFGGGKGKKEVGINSEKDGLGSIFDGSVIDGIDKNSIFDRVINWFKNGFQKVKDYISNLFGGNESGGILSKVKEFFGNLFGGGSSDSVGLGAGAEKKSIFQRLIDMFKGKDLTTVITAVAGGLGLGGIIAIIRKLTGASEAIEELGEDAAESSKDGGNLLKGVRGLKLPSVLAIIAGVLGAGALGLSALGEDKKKEIIDSVKGFLSDIWTKIKDTISGFFGGKKDSVAVGTEKDGIGGFLDADSIDAKKETIFDKIINWIKQGFNKVKNFILGLFGGKNEDAEEIKDYANGIITAGEGDIDGKKTIFEKIIDWFKEKLALIRGFFQRLVGNVRGDAETVSNKLKGALPAILLALMGALGVVGVIKLVKTIIKIVNKILGLADTIVNIPKNLNEALNGAPKQADQAGDKMLKIAGAIAIIAAAVILIGQMDWKQALQGGIVIVGITAILFFMLKALNKNFTGLKNKDITGLTTGIAAFIVIALSIAALVAVLTPLAHISWGDFWKIPLGLIFVIGAMFVVGKMIERGMTFKKENMVGLLSLCGSIYILVLSMQDIAKLKWEELARGIVGVGGLLTLLFAFGKLATSKSTGFKMKNNGFGEFIALVGAVAILCFAIVPIAKLQFGQLMQGLLAVGILLGMLYGLAWLVSKNKVDVEFSGLTQLIALAGAVAILCLAMVPISMFSFGQLMQGLLAVGILLGMLYGFVKLLNAGQKEGTLKDTAMVNLLAVAGAVVILVIAMIPLTLMPLGAMIKALVGIAVLMLMLGIFVKMVNDIKLKGAALAQLLAVSGAVILLILAMIPLSLMPLGQLVQSVIAIVALMAGLALVLSQLSKIKTGKESLTNVALLVTLGAVVYVLTTSLVPLAALPIPNLIVSVIGILAMLFAMVAVVNLLSKINNSKDKTIANVLMLVTLAGVIYVFSEAIRKVKDVKLDTILGFSIGLAALIFGMAKAVEVLSKVDLVAGLKGILLLSIGLAALLGVLALLIPVIMNVIAAGLENMMARLAVCGGMFGSFVSGMDSADEGKLEQIKHKFEILMAILGVVSTAGRYIGAVDDFETCMLKLSNAVSQFMFSTKEVGDPAENNGLKFIRAILDMKDDFDGFSIGDFAEDITNLGVAIDLFGASSLVGTFMANTGLTFVKDVLGLKDDICNFDIGDFHTDMVNLGEAVKIFGIAATGTESGDIQAGIGMVLSLAGAAKDLDALTKVPLDTLKTQIAGLGGALSIYATGASEAGGQVKGLKEEDTPKVQAAVELLKTVIATLNADGGFSDLPDLPDETNLGSFGTELAALAIAMQKFADASKDFDHVDKAVEVLGFLGTLRANLNTSRASVALVFNKAGIKEQTLTDFGIEIAALGDCLKAFADSVKDFTVKDNVYSALTFFRELRTKLKKDDIEEIKVFGDAGITKKNQITNFGVQIAALGKSLGKFSTSVKNFELSQNVENALKFFASLKEKLTKDMLLEIFVFGQAKVNSNALTKFGDNIGELGEALSKFGTNVNFDDDKEQKFKNAIKALNDLADIANILPRVGGLAGLISGEYKTIGQMALDIQSLGENFSLLSNALEGDEESGRRQYNSTLVDQALNSLKAFSDITALVNQFNLGQNYTWIDSAESIAARLATFMYYINHIYSDVGDDSAENGDATVIEGLVQMLINFDEAMDEFSGGKGLKNMSAFQAFRDMAEGIAALVNVDPALDFKLIGKNMSLGIEKGIEERRSEVVNAIIKTCTDAIEAAKNTTKVASPSKVFMQIGSFLSLGLSKGITKKKKDPVQSAIKMVEGVISGAKETAEVHSPSEVFIEIGEFLGEGLAIGLENGEIRATSAAEFVANATINAMKDALGIHSPSTVAEGVSENLMLGFLSGLTGKRRKDLEKAYTQLGEDLESGVVEAAPKLEATLNDFDWANVIDFDLANIEKHKHAWIDSFSNFLDNDTVKQLFGLGSESKRNTIKDIARPVLDYFNEIVFGIWDEINGEYINPSDAIDMKDRGMSFSEYIFYRKDQEKKDIERAKKYNEQFNNEVSEYGYDWWLNSDFWNSVINNLYEDDLKNIAQSTSDVATGIWASIRAILGDPSLLNHLDKETEEIELPADGIFTFMLGSENFSVKMKDGEDGFILDSVMNFLTGNMLKGELDSELEPEISITPVLDLSNVKAGAQDIPGLFNRIYGLSLGAEPGLLGALKGYGLANESLPSDYTSPIEGVKSEVASMREDLKEFSTAMSKMKFVMNTGAVVAAIGPEMDQYLGRQGYFSARSDIP